MNEIVAVVRELGPDERRVLLVLARRLLAGQCAYGRLDVARDGRDWRRERADELADALVYGGHRRSGRDAAGSLDPGRPIRRRRAVAW